MNETETLRITIEGDGTIEQKSDSSMLESLEAHGIEVHYHCREGFCGACRTKLLSGKVTYLTDPLAFIDDDEILPCCCKADQDVCIKLL
ncbi:ferredoxin [Planctobacterium marinum]|uniref:Ferredoxin n=2 Tax=Planctobacterium marinum TaxID=1631968 RepID=A0AA48HK09_9ALTE|nr:ferredoxin [Planctobacterium marinum]